MIRINLRDFPRLFNEVLPLVCKKTNSVSSKEAIAILKNHFNIDVVIRSGETLFQCEVDEKTYTWLMLKWL